MNKPQNPQTALLQFMLRAQYLARHDAKSERGYAMLMTSMISIAMLSLLAAYMTMTNLSKSSTNAYVDGTNTFYAAESGLNKRANILYEKFVDNATPTGSTTSIVMSNCYSVTPDVAPSSNDDFECRNYKFRYNNNIAAVRDSSGNVVLNEKNGNSNSVDYIANTYVKNNTVASTNTAIAPNPDPTTIPSGQTYAGLKALEYRYTVYATAIKPNTINATTNPGFTADEIEAKGKTTPTPAEVLLVNSYNTKKATADAANATSRANSSTNNTVLQMDFKSRVVPLFQFAAFYDGDLEINTGSDMTLSGPVHTNKNLYVLPYGSVTLSLGGKVTAAGSIYNRVDSYGYSAGGVTKMLLNGTSCSTAGNCFPDYVSTNTSPLTVSQITAFGGNVKDGVAGATILKSPPPGFLRKRNYFDNTVGDYYAKADMRLEMVPDRRNAARTIIPFNFTSITTGGTGTCTTTLPTQAAASTSAPEVAINRDPANNYIDPDRKNASNLKCHVFTKGQLQSLRQPVLVWTHTKQSAGLQTSERDILNRPNPLPTPATLTGDKDKILRALQVALVSTPSPITLDQLGTAFGDSIYNSGDLSAFKAEFKRLTSFADADIATVSPNQIAAMQGAWFMPAPIQVVAPALATNINDASNNTRGSGFYDGRERRWMNVLQTNIASLSVWNRDGLYVEASALPAGTVTDIDATLTTAYATNNAMKNATFNSGTGANFTDGLAFTRAELATINAAVPAITPKGLQTLGLGSIDTTEQGLVLYATVNDDLNGDDVIDDPGTTASPNTANQDVSLDKANPVYKKNADGTDALKKKADGTNFLDADGNTVKIIIDYPRKYKNSDTRKSPFGFAFNGGNYLPGALTLVSDQAVYTQGDFNNNGAAQTLTAVNVPDPNRLPASVIGDTITILSNECLSTSATVTTKNDLLVPKGQISCAVSPLSATPTFNRYYAVTNSTAVNAAFLSSIPDSNGNLPSPALATATNSSRGYGVGTNKFSGGLNNYIRMLEKWGGGGSGNPYFNYSGSFVSLSTPLESSGLYAGGNAIPVISSGVATFYQIPNRNFNFDDKFSNFQQLPPLSPKAVYLQQDVFKRSF